MRCKVVSKVLIKPKSDSAEFLMECFTKVNAIAVTKRFLKSRCKVTTVDPSMIKVICPMREIFTPLRKRRVS